jgi:hypothetical protein
MNDLATIPTDAITLKQAAATVPNGTGRGIHLNTIRRWATSGVRGTRLRTVVIGGRRMTRPKWLREFVEHLTAATCA